MNGPFIPLWSRNGLKAWPTSLAKEMGIKRSSTCTPDIKTLKLNGVSVTHVFGVFDVLVELTLLREGIDVPLKRVWLLPRWQGRIPPYQRGLIQTIDAVRNSEGYVIMYVRMTPSLMQRAIDETARRRGKSRWLYNESIRLSSHKPLRKKSVDIMWWPYSF